MKIGILTLPLYTNYGGILQAYALQHVLEKLGHDAHTIDIKRRKLPVSLSSLGRVAVRSIRKCLLGQQASEIFYESKMAKYYATVGQLTEPFINAHIKRLEIEDLSVLSDKTFSGLVVGSDQILRPKYFPKVEDAFLAFAKDWPVKRVAYAASFGTDRWDYSDRQTEACSDLIRHFDGFSVRENSGVGLCQKHLSAEVEHVLDPTMLLSRDDYEQLLNESNPYADRGRYLATYILDPNEETRACVEHIAQTMDLEVISLRNENEFNSDLPHSERIAQPVESWLSGLIHADFVVTDSFHGSAFSILLNRPFISCGNAVRGLARFESLFEMFDLKSRLIQRYADLPKDATFYQQDWTEVNQKLALLRAKSLGFLKQSLP